MGRFESEWDRFFPEAILEGQVPSRERQLYGTGWVQEGACKDCTEGVQREAPLRQGEWEMSPIPQDLTGLGESKTFDLTEYPLTGPVIAPVIAKDGR